MEKDSLDKPGIWAEGPKPQKPIIVPSPLVEADPWRGQWTGWVHVHCQPLGRNIDALTPDNDYNVFVPFMI